LAGERFGRLSGGLPIKNDWWRSIWRPGHLYTLCDICYRYLLFSGCLIGKLSKVQGYHCLKVAFYYPRFFY